MWKIAAIGGWSRAQRVEHRLKIRSQIILKAAEGCSGREIAKFDIPEVTVKWRAVLLTESLDGGRAAHGKPAKYDEVTVQRVLQSSIEPTGGLWTWNGRLIASIWPMLPPTKSGAFAPTRHRMERRHSWCFH